MSEAFLSGRVILHGGDCRDVVAGLADASIDAVVTDPPYALVSIGKRFGKPGAAPARHGTDGLYARASAGFMGQAWDTGETAFAAEFWAEILRVLKPGGHVVAFSGTRTYHRMVCAIEDAGFEIRDQLAWVYGSGFPKSHDVAKGIDKAAGVWRGRAGRAGRAGYSFGQEYERTEKGDPATIEAAQWQGWGTALKPAWEPIVLARKPLAGTVAETVLAHGTGAVNIDGCRVRFASEEDMAAAAAAQRLCRDPNRTAEWGFKNGEAALQPYLDGMTKGRWPANLVHDGSDEVVSAFPVVSSGALKAGTIRNVENQVYGKGMAAAGRAATTYDQGGDTGSAARFFYSAKADGGDRLGSKHPTVKPVDLMQWLCRLVTPPGGKVLDPFAGTGTTGEAAWREGFSAVLVEREAAYQDDIRRRLKLADRPTERASHAKKGPRGHDDLPLFGEAS